MVIRTQAESIVFEIKLKFDSTTLSCKDINGFPRDGGRLERSDLIFRPAVVSVHPRPV